MTQQAETVAVGVLMPMPMPHLRREFDYLVPVELREQIQFGVRVRVRFHGTLTTGWVTSLRTDPGLATLPVLKVLGPAVLSPELLELAELVALRNVGDVVDVLTAAVPKRVAGVEKNWPFAELALPTGLAEKLPVAVSPEHRAASLMQAPQWAGRTDATWPQWQQYLDQLASGKACTHQRSSLVLPATWPQYQHLVQAVAATLATGRRVLICVPDQQISDEVRAALSHYGAEQFAVLSAEQGDTRRYRAYLRIIAGAASIVIGTRSAVFAPVPNLGLLWLVDEADDAYKDPRAPYWHARDVAWLRSSSTPVLFSGTMRTPETQRLVDLGWITELSPPRAQWRVSHQSITTRQTDQERDDAFAATARLPHAAIRIIRQGLAHGSVLVQVPRAGYVPVVACQRCASIAHCAQCDGFLTLRTSGGALCCQRCGLPQEFVCGDCQHTRVKAVRVGVGRTALEFDTMFAQVPVITSESAAGVKHAVSADSAIVVTTPGAEPSVPGGYAAGVILDAEAQLAAPRLRATEQALHRWLRLLTLLRTGAPTFLSAAAHHAVVQALVRNDPIAWVQQELAARAEIGLPPSQRFFAIEGQPDAVAELLQQLRRLQGGLPAALGPVPSLKATQVPRIRMLQPVPYAQNLTVAARLGELVQAASAAKKPLVTIQADPIALE